MVLKDVGMHSRMFPVSHKWYFTRNVDKTWSNMDTVTLHHDKTWQTSLSLWGQEILTTLPDHEIAVFVHKNQVTFCKPLSTRRPSWSSLPRWKLIGGAIIPGYEEHVTTGLCCSCRVVWPVDLSISFSCPSAKKHAAVWGAGNINAWLQLDINKHNVKTSQRIKGFQVGSSPFFPFAEHVLHAEAPAFPLGF